MTVYTTRQDYIDQVITPALGDEINDFDVDGIADDMLVYTDGNGNANRAGLIENDNDFWEVAAEHDMSDN